MNSEQCAICGVPLRGMLAYMFRLAGTRRSERNPHICNRCNTHIEEGRVVELTVLFADMSSFTKLTQELGPERTHEVVNAFLTMAAEVLVEQGAFIDKYIGDSVMAFFNVPIRAADHATRAVVAAVRIQERMSGLGQHFGIPLRATVGIASGWARVGRLGPSRSQDFTAIGDAVNVASRLQAQAGPNEILMDGNVYRQVSPDFPKIEPEQLTLKGFLHPIETYRLGSGAYRDRPSAPKRETHRTFHLGSVILALLGAPCAGAVLLGPVATFLGIGSVLTSTSSYWIFDSPFLRIPALGLSATGALANIYAVAAVYRSRRRGSLFPGMTRLERRRTSTVLSLALLSLLITVFELYAHGALMRHPWP